MTAGQWWAYGSAFVVLVGVVGETIADLTNWVKSERWKKILAKGSALVLIVGLTGDVISIRLTQVATASLNAEAAQANERAGKAEERAGKAEERAALAESHLGDAKASSAQAEQHAAEANERAEVARKDAEGFRMAIAKAEEGTAQAVRDAARANQIAEEERLARLKIEQRLADRTITDEQATMITKDLRQFSGQVFEIVTYWDSKEPMAISNRIAGILVDRCGWKIDQPKQWVGMLGGVQGVLVYQNPKASQRTRQAAVALVKALNDQSIESEMKAQNDPDPSDKLTIDIGTKP